MFLIVTGTLPDPITPLGFDRFGVLPIKKTGTGDYLITLRSAFARDVIAFAQSTDPSVICIVSAVTASTVQITCWDIATGATPTDADLLLRIVGSEFSYDI